MDDIAAVAGESEVRRGKLRGRRGKGNRVQPAEACEGRGLEEKLGKFHSRSSLVVLQLEMTEKLPSARQDDPPQHQPRELRGNTSPNPSPNAPS